MMHSKVVQKWIAELTPFDKFAMPILIVTAVAVAHHFPWGVFVVFGVIGLFAFGGLFTLALIAWSVRRRHRSCG